MSGKKKEVRVLDVMKWQDHAACAGRGELFFEDDRPSIVRKAKVICATCSVTDECLTFALTHAEYGVWGGLTANQRRKLKRVHSTYGLAT